MIREVLSIPAGHNSDMICQVSGSLAGDGLPNRGLMEEKLG